MHDPLHFPFSPNVQQSVIGLTHFFKYILKLQDFFFYILLIKKNVYPYSNLENTIHKSNIQLSVTTTSIKKLYDKLQPLDSLIRSTYQKYIIQLMNGSYLVELRDDKQSSKVKFDFY